MSSVFKQLRQQSRFPQIQPDASTGSPDCLHHRIIIPHQFKRSGYVLRYNLSVKLFRPILRHLANTTVRVRLRPKEV